MYIRKIYVECKIYQMVKCRESTRVQTELDEFKVTAIRELCIVSRKMFTFFRLWVSKPQLVRL